MGRNFEIRGTRQLKNLFSYARKMEKMPKFIFHDNLKKLKKYWDSCEFQKLSPQAKKDRNSNVDGVGSSLHTYEFVPIGMSFMSRSLFQFSLFTWLTYYFCIACSWLLMIENLVSMNFARTHTSRHKEKKGSWVNKRSKQKWVISIAY